MPTWTVGDVSGSETLTDDDHLYPGHINELREAISDALVYNIEEYGAVGDGTTDDTSAIQDAIDAANAAGGGSVYFPEGTFKVTAEIDLYSNISLLGVFGKSVLDMSSVEANLYLLNADGTEGDTDNLTGNATKFDTTLSFSTTGYAAGDFLKLRADNTNVEDEIKQGEICQIKTVDDGATVTLYSHVYDTYTTANTAQVLKLTFLENILIDGIKFLGPDDNTLLIVGIDFDTVKNFRINNCIFEKTHYAGVKTEDCIFGTITNCHFIDATKTGYSYGYFASVGTQDVIFSGNVGRNLRHLFTCGGSSTLYGMVRRVTISNNVAKDMWANAFDTHSNGYDLTFDGNTASSNLGAGFGINGNDITIVNNVVTNCYGIGIYVSPETTDEGGFVISNNLIRNSGTQGIVLLQDNATYGHLTYLTITGNTIQNAGSRSASQAMLVSATATNSYKLENVVISSNSINCTVGGGIMLNGAANGSVSCNAMTLDAASVKGIALDDNNAVVKVSITGNSIVMGSSTSTKGIFIEDGDDNTVTGNVVSGAAEGITLDNSCTYNNVQSNNVRNCTAGVTLGAGAGNAQANNIAP